MKPTATQSTTSTSVQMALRCLLTARPSSLRRQVVASFGLARLNFCVSEHQAQRFELAEASDIMAKRASRMVWTRIQITLYTPGISRIIRYQCSILRLGSYRRSFVIRGLHGLTPYMSVL